MLTDVDVMPNRSYDNLDTSSRNAVVLSLDELISAKPGGCSQVPVLVSAVASDAVLAEQHIPSPHN